jgi:hypothetical protein
MFSAPGRISAVLTDTASRQPHAHRVRPSDMRTEESRRVTVVRAVVTVIVVTAVVAAAIAGATYAVAQVLIGMLDQA